MVWLYERGAEALRLETRFDENAREYVLVILWADGRAETERFREYAAFDARLRGLEQQLSAEHWMLAGSPTFLRDGWRIG